MLGHCFVKRKRVRAVDFPWLGRGRKMLQKGFILHITTSINVLAVVKILQNILAVSCLLQNIHEPALLSQSQRFLGSREKDVE